MNKDLPFVVEYAKSGRASCKQCKSTIGKDSLRIGIMVQSPSFDGKIPNWYHCACFFLKKKKIKSTDEISNFSNIRWEDQEKIKGRMSATNVKNNGAEADSDFSVEYAKSSRSTCKGCSEKILKDVLRISKLDRDNPETKRYGPAPQWHHVDCFVARKEELEFTDSADMLPGFKSLSEDDKRLLVEKIGKGVKRKSEDSTANPAPKKIKSARKEDNVLKIQNDLIFDMRDNLKKSFSKKDMVTLLEVNGQHISHGESSLLEHLTDCLLFGALKTCPDCKSARPRYKLDGYYCPGNISEWTKCQYNTKHPDRTEFTVPEDFRETFSFLKKYKYTKRERQFREERSSAKSLPLDDFHIALIGKLQVSQEIIIRGIQELGGTYHKTVDKSVNLCIGTEKDIKSNPPKVRKAHSKDVHIVSADFIEDVRKGTSPAVAVKNHLLVPWGEDPLLKFGIKKENNGKVGDVATSSKSGKSSSSSEKKIKVLKGAASVDPASGHENTSHVYERKGVMYNVVLGFVDVNRGTNSYYKIQLLESNVGSSYYVFRAWGRVGTTIGNNKLEYFPNLESAIASFSAVFLDKTGNNFNDRKNFQKKSGFMYPLDLDYGEDEKISQELKVGKNSKLPIGIQKLICLIFDIEAMKKAMVEFEIDLKKMPLGKLSKNQIKMAYKVLCDAQDIVTKGCNRTQLIDVSNRFYTLIPHDFGMKKPPLLEDDKAITSKIEMLDSLMEIEFAFNLIHGEDGSGAKDPVDKHYEQLKTDIKVLGDQTEEYKIINKYLTNTHASTHNRYKLHLEEVYKINRHGESENYKKFEDLHNKKLLWHGSRLTNFVGILSQGLRIAPPEAPCSGYMFGKGVYFADMVSKSANYCCTSRNNSTGLLLLCEVALGDMYEKKSSEFITKLPKNTHSTKGIGQTAPDPNDKHFVNNVEVPYGQPVVTDTTGSQLLYNEYIVYDVNQINIKYLLKVNFDYQF